MRMLRSIYNRRSGVGQSSVCIVCFMMFIREWIFQKKALPVGELNRLLYEDPKSERLCRTGYRCLMFQFCGMSFADLAHLEKSSLEREYHPV